MSLGAKLDGWFVNQYFRGRPARIRHDLESRTRDADVKLRMTNETFPYRPVINGKVDWRSKITFKLSRRPEWVERFREMLGEYVFGQFASPGYGWMDTNHEVEDYTFNLIQCGGNLVHVKGIEGGWAYVETQPFDQEPNPRWTYTSAPHLHIKQVLVGSSSAQKIYWICDKKRGDVIFPAVSPVQAVIPLEQLEFFPKLPFETRFFGRTRTINSFCFRGSDTYARVGLDWFLIEEMLESGDGSQLDRRVYVENWMVTCPPPVVGWTRVGETESVG